MKHADFVHFVRLSEYACAEQPERYRRNVALFAALGYAWVAACLLVATALLWWAVPRLWGGQVRYTTLAITVGALGLGWSSLRALLVRLDASTEGVRITQEQAPELFKALSRIQGKVQGPDLHEVYIHDDFNASITQRPRWGLLGGSINRLHLGLPLILALDVPRVLAVLAHEYGHLRGGHGRFAAWIYRTRLSWARLRDQLDDDSLAIGTTPPNRHAPWARSGRCGISCWPHPMRALPRKRCDRRSKDGVRWMTPTPYSRSGSKRSSANRCCPSGPGLARTV